MESPAGAGLYLPSIADYEEVAVVLSVQLAVGGDGSSTREPVPSFVNFILFLIPERKPRRAATPRYQPDHPVRSARAPRFSAVAAATDRRAT